VETIFAWPGIGLYAVQSMYKLDYAPVLAVTIIATTSYIVVYFLADLFSSLIDPRIRKS
jgi:peptide/nickel transport system permease protein